LNGLENDPKSAEWIGMPNEPLKGFSWKSGVERHTTGIVFWSDVFLHTTEDGEELAIILIDTQGLFDHDTPPAINSKIFTFTTLMSSYQIYNLPQLIHEDELEYLQVF
jgi:atlastin